MRKDSYDIAFQKAASLLRGSSLEIICAKTGAKKNTTGIGVRYFQNECSIQLPEVIFESSNLRQSDQILILHYLTHQGNRITKDEYVAFKDLPNAMFYEYAYRKRGPDRILHTYGNDPDAMLAAAETLGAQKGTFGDVSVRFFVFPKIGAQIVLHRGDEEFPPDLQLLFTDNIVNFLDLEDVALLAGKIADRLS